MVEKKSGSIDDPKKCIYSSRHTTYGQLVSLRRKDMMNIAYQRGNKRSCFANLESFLTGKNK